jgi:hypothetical protein
MQSYTLHISLPGHGRLWRKLELAEEATLQDLHMAIQRAFNFDNDHLYSFFMSGKAWDRSSEYSLPEGASPWDELEAEDDEFDEEDDEELIDDAEDEKEDDLAAFSSLPALGADGLAMPTPDQLRAMFGALNADEATRNAFIQAMSAQMGLPEAMARTLFSNLDNAIGGMSDQQLNAMLNIELDEDDARDVRATTLASLDLKKGKKFLYLFDYGDEWQFTIKVDAVNRNADPNRDYPLLVESVGDAPEQYPDWEEEA